MSCFKWIIRVFLCTEEDIINVMPNCSNRGFTLVEMLIVISVVGLLASAFVLQRRNVNEEAALTASASKILEAAKDTRQRSLSVDEFANNLFPSYGLHFDVNEPRKVVVYADCLADDNDDGTLTNKDYFAFDENSTNCDGGNGFIREVSLSSNTFIQDISATGAFPDDWETDVSQSRMDMLYLRPEPTLWITDADGNLMSSGYFEVILATDSGKTKQVVFSINGSAYVDS